MQVERLGRAVRVAGEALSRGDIRAVAPFIKAVETLDRYQSLARETAPRRPKKTAGDALVMKTVVERIREQVLEECRREAAGGGVAAAAPRPDPSPGADGDPAAVPPPLAAELQPASPPPDPSPRTEEAPAAALPPAPELRSPLPHSAPPTSPWGTWAC